MDKLKKYCDEKQLYYFMNGYDMQIELGSTTISINEHFILDMMHFPRMGVGGHYWNTLRDIMAIMEEVETFNEPVGTI